MDPATISITAAAAFGALQPYLPTIATKASEEIGKQLPAAVGKMWSALKAKFDTKQAAKDALTDLLKNPDDYDLQAAFRVQIKKAMEDDPAFADAFKPLVDEASTQVAAQTRDGAIAIGDHAKAVGAGGILIEGNVKSDVLGSGAKKEEK
jgi:hypothetical protein